jgi:hypothetical protein
MEPNNSISAIESDILSTGNVSGYTHCFYNYPARFSPKFSRTIIKNFSKKGDLILDPFMGGGTSIIEGIVLGRMAIGIDINDLAFFITKVKTTIYNDEELQYLKLFSYHLIDSITIIRHFDFEQMNPLIANLRNVDTNETWRITRLLGIYREKANLLPKKLGDLFRCVLLKAGQWALDNNKRIPLITEFRIKVKELIIEFINGAVEYRNAVHTSGNPSNQPVLHKGSATNVNRLKSLKVDQSPKLIITSPPYPGVHILYHRWQIKGRKETAVPYWIANIEDGHGESYYTFGSRNEESLKTYYKTQYKVFKALSKIADCNTIIVQLIAFPHPEWQLDSYLKVMNLAGYKEYDINLEDSDGNNRIWRDVPNRKWYSQINNTTMSNKEVVLIHKLKD